MMKRISFLLACLLLAVYRPAYAYSDGDFQVWNTDTQEFKINKDLKLAFEEEFRWGGDAREFYYHHYDIGLSYGANKHLSLGSGYRQVYELRKGKFQVENEPYLTTTLCYDYRDFSFDSRNRLEYRHFDFQGDSWRYRNKFTLKFPDKVTGLEIQPYLADEIFIGFGDSKNSLNQNRVSFGLGMNLVKNLKAEVYYMLVSSKSSGRWSDSNVLGTKLKLSF